MGSLLRAENLEPISDQAPPPARFARCLEILLARCLEILLARCLQILVRCRQDVARYW